MCPAYLQSMKQIIIAAMLAGLSISPAWAHCDSETGPVAKAAQAALASGNVNVALPYVQPSAEAEVTSVFRQAIAARSASTASRTVADRHFVETVVRLHRLGENAPYTGLKPGSTDFGPAIPAAEHALDTRSSAELQAMLTASLARSLRSRFEEVVSLQRYSAVPKSHDGVPNARRRVRAELEFEKYADSVYRAISGLSAGEESTSAACPGVGHGL